jgi:hypothetical protein
MGLPVKNNSVALISEEICLVILGIPVDIRGWRVVIPVKEGCLIRKNTCIAVVNVVQSIGVWDVYCFGRRFGVLNALAPNFE